MLFLIVNGRSAQSFQQIRSMMSNNLIGTLRSVDFFAVRSAIWKQIVKIVEQEGLDNV